MCAVSGRPPSDSVSVIAAVFLSSSINRCSSSDDMRTVASRALFTSNKWLRYSVLLSSGALLLHIRVIL